MDNMTGFECVACGQRQGADFRGYVCPSCGNNLQVTYDYDRVREELDLERPFSQRRRDLFRYLPLLPVNDLSLAPSLRIGATPLFRGRRLGHSVGLDDLWLKDEGLNPSASFKDRASAVAVTRARELGAEIVAGASTGNAGSSMACMAARVGVPCVIFVPAAAPAAKIAQLLIFGAQVLAVRGTYDQAFDLCHEVCERRGWFNRNTGYNPYTREGKKTCSFEFCEQFAWKPPDRVVVPVGDGNIISGIWKGLKELRLVGLIDRLPKLVCAQSEGSAAISDAVVRLQREHSDPSVIDWSTVRIDPVRATTVADSISVDQPRDGLAAVRAVIESGGDAVTVPDGRDHARRARDRQAVRSLCRAVLRHHLGLSQEDGRGEECGHRREGALPADRQRPQGRLRRPSRGRRAHRDRAHGRGRRSGARRHRRGVMSNDFYKLAKEVEPALVKYLRDIIAIPSMSCDEERVVHRIQREMEKLDFDEATIDPMGNLIGRVGSGPKSIALDAHIDTVEATDLELWETDPFDPVVKDGAVFGRGTSDMKAGNASSVYAAAILKRSGLLPDDLSLYVTATVQEEDCDGLCWQYIINEGGLRPDCVVITEPTSLAVYRGQRGRMEIEITTRGHLGPRLGAGARRQRRLQDGRRHRGRRAAQPEAQAARAAGQGLGGDLPDPLHLTQPVRGRRRLHHPPRPAPDHRRDRSDRGGRARGDALGPEGRRQGHRSRVRDARATPVWSTRPRSTTRLGRWSSTTR